MAKKKDVKENAAVVEAAEGRVQAIPEVAGLDSRQGAEGETEGETEGEQEISAEELQVQFEQGSGDEKNSEGSAGVDSERKEETVVQDGAGISDPLAEGGQKPDNAGEPETLKYRLKARDVFKKNSQCKILYFTADLIPFYSESDALRHGFGTLKNGTVVTVKRQ